MGARPHEACGYPEILGERAVQILEIRAQVLPARAAVVALAAGGGVGDHHPLADREAFHPGARRGHGAGHLVAEQSGYDQHARMAAAAVHLDVGTAGGGGPHPEDDLVVGGAGYRHLADLDALGSGEYRSAHGFGQCLHAPLDSLKA